MTYIVSLSLMCEERDARISFDENSHTYFVDGKSKGYVSTTQLVRTMFEKFDANEVIKKMKSSKNWSKSKYFGMSDEEIRVAWEKQGKDASMAGTMVHKAIDKFYTQPPSSYELPSGREFEMFKDFVNDHPHFVPHKSEWFVFDNEAKVCGAIDMVYEDCSLANRRKSSAAKSYVIVDWKRCKEIKYNNHWKNGLGLCSSLPDCNFIHYSLQLAIYKYILEKNYGIVIAHTFLVVLHPSQEKYLKIESRNVDVEISRLMGNRLDVQK